MKKREIMALHPSVAKELKDLQKTLYDNTGQQYSMPEVSFIWYSSVGRPLIKVDDKKVKLI